MRATKRNRRVSDVATWLLAETRLAAPVSAWKLARRVGLTLRPVFNVASAELEGRLISYDLVLMDAHKHVLRETCRYVLRLWRRCDDDTTSNALAARLSACGEPCHLYLVASPTRPGVAATRPADSAAQSAVAAPRARSVTHWPPPFQPA